MRRISILVAVMLTLSACGAAAKQVADKAADKVAEQALQANDLGDANVDVDSDSGQIEVSGTDPDTGEDINISVGGTDVPADFPMPLPDTGQVVAVNTVMMGDATAYEVRVQIDPGDWDAIRDFYEKWMTDQGMDPFRTDEGLLGSTDEGAVATVVIDDVGGSPVVNLNWTP